MNIAIIGTGYVGSVTGACLAKIGHKVINLDIDEDKINLYKSGKVPIYEPGLGKLILEEQKKKRLSFSTSYSDTIPKSEVIYIAVGTPSRKDGKADLTYVEAAAKEIAKNMNGYKVIVNKSTVPVGTGTKIEKIISKYYKGKFDIVSNPEFLREGSAVKDFLKPDRVVIGSRSNKARDIMLKVYEKIDYPKVTTLIESAEMTKYASNAFLATKISFINEIANICEKVGADVEDVARGMGMDKRIGMDFLRAGIGYGGSCFPKDVNALDQIAGTKGYDFKLIKSVIEVNNRQRTLIIDKLEDIFDNLKEKKVCVLGLAFKKDTDDIRESAAIDIIKMLSDIGARITTYDAKAAENSKKILKNKNVEFCKNPYEAVKKAEALIIATDWTEFQKLNYKKIKKLMKRPNIIDGRNILDPEKMKKLGFKYSGVGRKV
ncbi:MAG: UDP-glucose/GDP-mannose dehydrogenase family protein [Parcubacteria group bacterium]|nr:UDP-glucose/GDP-mannose dehydrogenase family protein [Parcubacteria group bacterium]